MQVKSALLVACLAVDVVWMNTVVRYYQGEQHWHFYTARIDCFPGALAPKYTLVTRHLPVITSLSRFQLMDTSFLILPIL